MKSYATTLGGLAACAALFVASPTLAQTTDGYHSIQVFPVVVDTAAFTQRFQFHNPANTALSINVKYFPAEGTSQAAPLDCAAVAVAAGQMVTFASLRLLCPGLATGSQFGFLHMRETETRAAHFAAYSRVSNPQGNGFSVEAFPASTFTSSMGHSVGVRRLAASGGSPAYQTNCFVGGLNDLTAAPGGSMDTIVRVLASNGAQLGVPTVVPVQPGKLTRILDIFAFVGANPGDYNDARVEFIHDQADPAALLNFCTVQDNTSFGADFRIAKQRPVTNANDSLYSRDSRISQGVATTTHVGYFKLLAGGPRHNTHVMYFRHPDDVQCEIIDPTTGVRALPSYGLEMRMITDDGSTVIAGGDDQTGFGKIYLGDKKQRGLGSNARYTIDVESTDGGARPNHVTYDLRCQSGSGHSLGDLIVDNVEENLF